ncbi:MAG: radical SAM protein [Candidatus Omnitrophica bacterium]|nr:radical SAM protein [Candidatus Omnitrophota bacterium]
MKTKTDEFLIDGHKLYWHLDRVLDWQEKKIISPLYLEVSPVAYCNHQCIFCAYDFARQNSLKLKSGIFYKRLKEMAKLGVRSMLYSGEGEPLLHPDIAQFIQISQKSGIDVALASNASLGNKQIWQEILPYLTWARFSLDSGSAAVYAKVHGVGENIFAKTINSIQDAVSVKRAKKLAVTIGVQFLVLEENLKDLENALKVLAGSGIDYLSIKPYSRHPLMKRGKDVIYTPETQSYIEGVLKRNKRLSAGLKVVFRKEAMNKYLIKENKFKRCRALSFWGHISARGDFYTCGVFIGDKRFKAGNIYQQDMKEILFGSARRKSIQYGGEKLNASWECRLNCRMARINEFLDYLDQKPAHQNFI